MKVVKLFYQNINLIVCWRYFQFYCFLSW